MYHITLEATRRTRIRTCEEIPTQNTGVLSQNLDRSVRLSCDTRWVAAIFPKVVHSIEATKGTGLLRSVKHLGPQIRGFSPLDKAMPGEHVFAVSEARKPHAHDGETRNSGTRGQYRHLAIIVTGYLFNSASRKNSNSARGSQRCSN